MKRLIPIMVILCVGLAAFVGYYRFYSDRTGPVIYFDENSAFVYQDGMINTDLLENVTAIDAKDGDVTDSLEVESVYAISENEVVITYVAKDLSMNISKAKRTVSYQQAESENSELKTTVPEDQPEQQKIESTEPPEPAKEDSPETSQQVSAEPDENEAAKAEQEAAANAMDPASPRIYLTDYVVELPLGASVDRLSYVREITDDADNVYDLWHKISIIGDLDTSSAGTYENTYFVTDSQQNTPNLATIRFIVK